MKLSDEQRTILQEKLKGFKLTCNVCGGKNFTVFDRFFELREFNDGDLVIGRGSSVIPLVVFACDNCGTLITMNALVLGVLDNAEKRVNPNEPAKQ